MNDIMTYNNLSEFLKNHKAGEKGSETERTHTRIGSKELNVFGGSYHISGDDLNEFYKLYYQAVVVERKKEYLTEIQINEGPILVDFDFRYDSTDVKTRQHTPEHIQDMIHMYLEELKHLFSFTDDTPFDIYIMEKPNVNILQDKPITKDGIHMIIGIKSDHTIQMMLRDRIVKKINECWGDLPLKNESDGDLWENVIDRTISSGHTGWQLFGSQKPGHEAYKLTHHMTVTYNTSENDFDFDVKNVTKFDFKKDFVKLTARNPNNPSFELTESTKEEYEKFKEEESKKMKKSNSKSKKLNLLNIDDIIDENTIDGPTSLSSIKNQQELDYVIDKLFSSLKVSEYHLKELHEYTQILPGKYYEPGSHFWNRQVAFALKHTDDRLFVSWVKLRSKASDFSYSTIPELYNSWKYHFNNRPDGVTRRSIIYWAKQDAFEAYEKVKKTTLDYYIEESLSSESDYDLAMVLYQMFKDKYVCSSIIHKTWYVFKNHRWELDKGESLRLAISRDMYNVYQDKVNSILGQMHNKQDNYNHLTTSLPNEDMVSEHHDKLARKGKKISQLSSTKLKFATGKNNIIREAMAIFYDPDFIKSMDANKYLMCFTNGVVDFKNKIFRPGYPQDYITKCTNIAYIPYDKLTKNELQVSNDILDFMEKLFPLEGLNRYMWDHLASVLIGAKKEQVFNIYCGSGSNGKSILTDLMERTLGDYKGTVPITLVTEKRNNIGGVSPEVLQLKGVRYAVMQEPSKDQVINEGILKELTGGDPIQARALYSDSEIFEPQFSLVVCTNSLFEFKSNDDGTWRRVMKVDFLSKFYSEGEVFTDETKYLFPKDKSLKEKLPNWAVVFASMLVARAFETEGEVALCDIVTESSRNYRQAQDVISGFINEKIVKDDGSDPNYKGVGQQTINEEFKQWFQGIYGNRKPPKLTELTDAINKKFGQRNKNNKWAKIRILQENDDDDINDL